MKSAIRLDSEGNPYLIVYYEDKEGDGESALDDAERLFFTKLNQNGGLLHLVPGKDKQMRMLVTTGLLKRKANVTESTILGDPSPRASASAVERFTPSDHAPLIKSEAKASRLDADEHDEFPPMHGGEEDPGCLDPR